MPYYARKHQLGRSLIYHAFNRSNTKVSIFNLQDNYLHFMELLKEYSQSACLEIYHWVIMPNHYHLLFEIEEPEAISKFMAGLNRAYTHYYHKAFNSCGFLWQGRFKLQPVQKERYLTACGRYIERNPVRADIVKEAADYPYSSARRYCLGRPDGITSEDPLFAQFGDDVFKRQLAYRKFLRDFDSEEEKEFRSLESPRGDSEFISRLTKEHGRYIPRRKGRRAQTFVM